MVKEGNALLPREASKVRLIGHIIVDYPSAGEALKLIDVMAAAGVAVIELQIPFSEPMADGPLFMAANHEALAAGVTVERCLNFLRQVAAAYPYVNFVLMTYANIVYSYGYEAFARQAAASGAKGVIVPDLPFDSDTAFLKSCEQHGLAPILVFPPNMPEERLAKALAAARGFVYVAGRSGVTGAKTNFGAGISTFLKAIRDQTSLPVAVGFGIDSPEHVAFLRGKADMAIIGSHALRTYRAGGLAAVRAMWQALAAAGL